MAQLPDLRPNCGGITAGRGGGRCAAGVPHNIVIHPMDSMTPVFRGELITGPKTVVYHVGRLKPGQYHFHCEVHKSTMYGSFVVAAAPPGGPAAPPSATAAGSTPPRTSAGAPPQAAMSGMPGAKGDMAGMPGMNSQTAPPDPARSAAGSAAPTPQPAGAAQRSAATATPLARTGPGTSRSLVPLAGFVLAVAGLALMGGARRLRPTA